MWEKSRLFEKYAFAPFKKQKTLGMGQKRDSNPFNGPKWENCWDRDLFGHLKVKFFSVNEQVISPTMLLIRKMLLFVGETLELTETDWLKGISKTQQLSVIKPSLTFRLEKNVWNAFIKTLYGFRLNSTITFVTLLASLDYRSVTEAKYLWGLCMSITSVCFPPYVCSVVTE